MSHYTRLDYDIYCGWESGIWWRFYYHVDLILEDNYRSTYQA